MPRDNKNRSIKKWLSIVLKQISLRRRRRRQNKNGLFPPKVKGSIVGTEKWHRMAVDFCCIICRSSRLSATLARVVSHYSFNIIKSSTTKKKRHPTTTPSLLVLGQANKKKRNFRNQFGLNCVALWIVDKTWWDLLDILSSPLHKDNNNSTKEHSN